MESYRLDLRERREVFVRGRECLSEFKEFEEEEVVRDGQRIGAGGFGNGAMKEGRFLVSVARWTREIAGFFGCVELVSL